MANSLAAVEEEAEAVDAVDEVAEAVRLEAKEEAATSNGTKRRGSRAELKVLLTFRKTAPLI